MGEMGSKETRLNQEREEAFPFLAACGYYKTSDETPVYNCVAYAAGDQTQKWGVTSYPPNLYWPEGASKGDGIDDLKSAFEVCGWERATGGDVEEGFDKVALYADDEGEWQHAAIQWPNGEWSSKLGDWEDIRHANTHAVSGGDYGKVWYYMKKRKLLSVDVAVDVKISEKDVSPSPQNKIANVMPEFDEAMKKIVATPKSEVERREQAERDAKSSSK